MGDMMDYQFKTEPYDHQRKVFGLSRDLPVYAILAEQGTGKSKIVIDTAAWLFGKGDIRALFVIAPNGVHTNWVVNEIPTHLPDHIPYRMAQWVAAPKKVEKEALEALWDADDTLSLRILSMNIEALSTPRGTAYARKFLNAFPSMMVIDEASKIKTPGAKRTRSTIALGKHAPYRRILTGTLITQSPLDAYAPFKFLDPDILGHSSFVTFKSHFAEWEQHMNYKTGKTYKTVTGYRNLDELQQKIQSHSFRILKADCLDLPEKVYERRYVELTPTQKRLYKAMSEQLRAEFEGGEIKASIALTKLLRLQQIVGGFAPVEDPYTPGQAEWIERDLVDAKIHAIDDKNPRIEVMLDAIEESLGKVIIWARFRAELEAIEKKLTEVYGEGSVAAYHGGVKKGDREDGVARFQGRRAIIDPKTHMRVGWEEVPPEKQARFFVGQQHSAGYGLTLTAANTVIYYSNDFSLEARLQSEDRAHRIGQTSHVTYIDLEARNTIDSRIIAALRTKKNIADMVTGDELKKWL